MINRPLDMLFNAPTLSFIHTLCVLWVGSKPIYSTIINIHVFNNPIPYYHGRGPMLHNYRTLQQSTLGWADAIFGQNEVLSTPQVPPTVVTARAGGVRWAIVVAS